MTYETQVSIGKNVIDSNMNVKKKCVVFDIDDTLIDTKEGSIIYPIYNLYKYAQMKGISTILITARSGLANNIDLTVSQLSYNKISYDLIYFRPEYMTDVEKYKLFARKHLYESGYTCIFSIGDMYWDVGEYGGIPILI